MEYIEYIIFSTYLLCLPQWQKCIDLTNNNVGGLTETNEIARLPGWAWRANQSPNGEEISMNTEATYNCGGDDVAYVTPQTINCLPASHRRRVSRIGCMICCSSASGNHPDNVRPEHDRTNDNGGYRHALREGGVTRNRTT